MTLAASAGGHREHDYRAIEIGDLRLGSLDGTVTRMPDTSAKRAELRTRGRSRTGHARHGGDESNTKP